jgi:hypothetical protein
MDVFTILTVVIGTNMSNLIKLYNLNMYISLYNSQQISKEKTIQLHVTDWQWANTCI